MDDGKQVVAYVNDECVSCGWGDLNLGVQGDGRKASTSTDKNRHTYTITHILGLNHFIYVVLDKFVQC